MKELLAEIAEERGTPCYVYFMDQVYERIQALDDHFGGRFQVSYAVKSNPNPKVLERLKGRVASLDVSSGGELRLALAAGWRGEDVSFTGPGKREAELAAAVEHAVGEVVVESVREAEALNAIAGRARRRQPVLVRIAPAVVPRGFGDAMAGKPSAFGIDEEIADAALRRLAELSDLEICGFHIYSGTQFLKAEAIVQNYEMYTDIFRGLAERHGLRPRKLIFGAGIGIPYHEGDEPVDLAQVAKSVNPMLDALAAEPSFAGVRCMLETGRFLIGEAGVFLTRVVDKKWSRGVDVCVCDGGMNHHLAACGHMGMVVHRNYRMFKLSSQHPDGPSAPFHLTGPLCTSIDTLARGAEFPGLEIGDVVGIRSSGAYGLTSSPLYFISHDPPGEWLVEDRRVVDARRPLFQPV